MINLVKHMTKKKLALRIARAIYKDRRRLESFNTYQSIKNYSLDLETADLVGIAGQYGVQAHYLDGT